jgi:hypothetical protein
MCPPGDLIYACFANEISEAPRVNPPSAADEVIAAVAANHVPWRISDDGIETGTVEPSAVCVHEHFGKGERPVEELMAHGY